MSAKYEVDLKINQINSTKRHPVVWQKIDSTTTTTTNHASCQLHSITRPPARHDESNRCGALQIIHSSRIYNFSNFPIPTTSLYSLPPLYVPVQLETKQTLAKHTKLLHYLNRQFGVGGGGVWR